MKLFFLIVMTILVTLSTKEVLACRGCTTSTAAPQTNRESLKTDGPNTGIIQMPVSQQNNNNPTISNQG